MPSFGQIAQRMSPKGWAMLGGSVAVGIAFLMIVMQMASAPSYSTLMAGVNPAQTGKITSTLSAEGIAFELQNGGTAVAVESDKTAQARVALAGAGLLTASNQPGFSLMDSQQLGQSTFQQQITYERALEGQLAQTIETINGVSSAEVNLVLPNSQDQLFADNSQPATASVLLSDSGSLDPGSVRGIAQLVSSSVPSLALDKVTITDSNGDLLWPSADGSDAGGLPALQSADQRYDSSMSTEVNTVLASMLGTGKAQVVVNANLNANQATSDSLTYAQKGVPLQSQISTETLKGGSPSASGVTGTAGNIPAYTSTGSANSSYADKTNTTTFGVDKTITHSTIAPGAINQQSISVLVDKSVPATELPIIKAAVANAVGLQTKRGDTLSIGQLAFATPKVVPTAAAPSSMMKYAKYGGIGLASLIFLIFSARLLRRRESESFAGQPTWLRELESPRTLASLEQGRSGHTEVAALRPPVNIARQQVEELVQRDPERVAQQVRAWMAEE
ncbi:MAG: flagellar basal-body MS-ring/collar protein FliF [Solirubrobacteraceae bacterium]